MGTNAQLVEKALEISRKRRRALVELRAAVRTGDRERVFLLAKKFVGGTDEKRPRTDPRIN
jgi:hypothetical protein